MKQYLIDHKSQFRTFWKGDAEVKSLFKSGEIVISSGYPDPLAGMHGERDAAEHRPAVVADCEVPRLEQVRHGAASGAGQRTVPPLKPSAIASAFARSMPR